MLARARATTVRRRHLLPLVAVLLVVLLVVLGARLASAQSPASKMGPYVGGLANPPTNVVPVDITPPGLQRQPLVPANFGGPPYSPVARLRFRALSNVIALDADAPIPIVQVLIETDAPDSQLAAVGAQVMGRVGPTVAASIPITALEDLASISSVRRIRAARLYRPTNDLARAANKGDIVGTDLGLDGSGVLVGIVDSGIDIFHADFRNADGTTRIVGLRDLIAGLTCDESDINELLTSGSPKAACLAVSADTNGHGTHVAGSAGGNGLATGPGSAPSGTYAGMAPART